MPDIPIEGFAWNPLASYPRNERCFCESGKKAKRCCLINMTRAVPIEIAEKLKSVMRIVEKAREKKRGGTRGGSL